MTSRRLTAEETAHWGKKLNNGSIKPEAMKFADSGTIKDNDPYVLRVTNGQWDKDPGKKTLVIQVYKRLDIPPDRAIEVIQSALIDVFGEKAGSQAECDYRNVGEIKKKLKMDKLPDGEHDTATIIFAPGPIVYTQRPERVRDRMALALRTWHERSLNW